MSDSSLNADLDKVVDLLLRFARSEFDARADSEGMSEQMAVVITGLNMLGEELAYSRDQLSAKNRLLENVVDNVCELIYVGKFKAFQEGAFTYFSPQLQNILGYTPEEICKDGSIIFDAIHPDDMSAVSKMYDSLAGGAHASGEYRVKHKHTGQYIWLEDSLSVHASSDGWITIYGAAREISSRKLEEVKSARAYEELSLIEHINRATIQGAAIPDLLQLMLSACIRISGSTVGRAYLIDPDTDLLTLQGEAINERVRGDILKSAADQPMNTYTTLPYSSQLQANIRKGEITFTSESEEIEEVRALGLAWSDINLRSIGIVPLLKNNTAFAVILLFTDSDFEVHVREAIVRIAGHITAALSKTIAEQKFREQKAFIDSILNNLPVDVAVYNPEHRFVFINKHSVPNDEFRAWLVGKDNYDYCRKKGISTSLADRRHEEFQKMLETGNETEWVDDRVNAKGKPVNYLRRNYPYYEGGKLKYVIEYGIDYTRLRVSEREREKLLKDLGHKYNEMMQFNYIVSHNLRAPVSRILGMSNLMKFLPPGDDRDQINDFMIKCAESIDDMIKDLNIILSYRSPLNEKKERFSLSNLIATVKDNLDMQISGSGVTLQVAVDEDAEQINSIKSYVQSAMLNLISNAVKYRSTEKSPFIYVSARKSEGQILIKVRDNGIGIDLEKHGNYVFGLYKRFNAEIEGKGLGLHMTKTQIEAVGGSIQVESIVGMGSTFTITLPADGALSAQSIEALVSRIEEKQAG